MKKLIAHLLLAIALVLAGPVGHVLGDVLATEHHGEEHGSGGHPHDSKCLMSPSCGVAVWSLTDPKPLVIRMHGRQHWPRPTNPRLHTLSLDVETPPPRIV